MTISPILSLARKQAGNDKDAQIEFLAKLCLDLGFNVSSGFVRAIPREVKKVGE